MGSHPCFRRRRSRLTDFPILLELGLIVVAAAAVVLVARLVRTPTIIAYIVAGLLLGPVTGVLEATETVELIAELGIALLLFLVGLELSLDNIRDVGKVALIGGLAQVGLTAAGGAGLALLMGFSPVESAFLAAAVAFSSTVAAVKVLTQKRELGTLYGRIAVGILLLQDVVVILLLTVLAALEDPQAVGAGQILGGVARSFGGMLLLLAAALLAARYVLRNVFGWMARSPEGLFIWALTWCFLFVVGAEALHISPEIGAFLAGVSLAQLPFNTELRRRVHPLMNFFVMVFFVSLGVQMDLAAAAAYWKAAVVLSLFVLVGKPLLLYFVIRRLGPDGRTALLSSATLAQISEFSFVVAALGLSAGLIDERILSLVGVMGLGTIGVSVFVLSQPRLLERATARVGAASVRPPERPGAGHGGPQLEDHVIVVGMNALGTRIVRDLVESGERVLAIDTDAEKLEGLPCSTVLGSTEHLSVLEEANLDGAKLLVSALQIEEANNLLAFRGRAAGVPTSIHAFDRLVMDELREIGADYLIQSKTAGTRRLATEVVELDQNMP